MAKKHNVVYLSAPSVGPSHIKLQVDPIKLVVKLRETIDVVKEVHLRRSQRTHR